MSNLSDDLKKAFLFGVGAIAKTSEKSKKLIDEFDMSYNFEYFLKKSSSPGRLNT